MNTILIIALRNVTRQKRRVFITALTIAIGIAGFVVIDGMFAGWDGDSLRNTVTLTDGALSIATKAYDDERDSSPLSLGMPADTIRAYLAKDSRVAGATPRTVFRAEATDGERSIPIRGIVIDPERDPTVFALTNFIRGAYLTGSNRSSVLVGAKLARDLALSVGGTITVSARTRYESHNADDFPIAGIFETTNPALNEAVVMSYTLADDFLDLEGSVTELFVSLKHPPDKPFTELYPAVRALKIDLTNRYPSLTAATVEERNAAFVGLMAQKKKFSGIVILVVMLIAAVGIVNTVLMSVYERVREVGVLRALGFTPKEVVRMFVIEGFIVGTLGSIGGVILGILINLYLVNVGMDVTAMPGADKMASSLPVWGTMKSVWNAKAFVQSALFGMIIALIASIIPARRAGKITVTSALRFQ
ncbi:MAG: FtsX-like permease family protein [Spirochaetota bacterium]